MSPGNLTLGFHFQQTHLKKKLTFSLTVAIDCCPPVSMMNESNDIELEFALLSIELREGEVATLKLYTGEDERHD